MRDMGEPLAWEAMYPQLPRHLIVFLLGVLAYEAAWATGARTYPLPIKKPSGYQGGDNCRWRADGRRYFEFVGYAWEERQGDLAG